MVETRRSDDPVGRCLQNARAMALTRDLSPYIRGALCEPDLVEAWPRAYIS